MNVDEKRNVPKNPAPARPLPDDGPEDMELSLTREPAAPVNKRGSLFDEEAKRRFGGINTAASVFEKGALFHTETDTAAE
jgi:hypothetical protein